jgi:hypothetical protein
MLAQLMICCVVVCICSPCLHAKNLLAFSFICSLVSVQQSSLKGYHAGVPNLASAACAVVDDRSSSLNYLTRCSIVQPSTLVTGLASLPCHRYTLVVQAWHAGHAAVHTD